MSYLDTKISREQFIKQSGKKMTQEITDHHGNYGIDSVMMAKIKIHKHYKGKNYCKGADRTITLPLDKTLKDNERHR